MNREISIFLAAILVLLLAGCGDDSTQKAQAARPAMSEENVFKPQVDALSKAKGVEQTIQSGFDQNRREIDAE